MKIQNRVRELRFVKADRLRPNPRNWRTHPDHQRDALRGLLAEIGYADALIARELPGGDLELIDGHLRAEITPETEVPVLVVDLDEQEAAKLLALLDPLAGLAEANEQLLAELLAEVDTHSAAVQAMLDQMEAELKSDPPAGTPLATGESETETLGPEVVVPDCFQVVVECRDEAQQRALYERLTAEGYSCRVLTL